ncbi:MAG: glycosyltransferase family 9 protein [Candidatus Sumerlaeaceae bacterium]
MKILLKAPNWIGDCVMATPAVAYLRCAFPSAKLVMLSRRSTAGIWQDHPLLDELIVADDRELTREQIARLRRQNFDAALLLPNSFRSAWTIWRCGIPRRFGYNRAGRIWFLTDPLSFRRRDWQTPAPQPVSKKSLRPSRNDKPPRHMVEYYLDLAVYAASRLGANCPPPIVDRTHALPPLVLPVQPTAAAAVHQLLLQEGVSSTTPLIGIHPGAAYGSAKRWPLDRLARAADVLARQLDATVIITAGPTEQELSAQLARNISAPVLELGPRLDLPALAALLQRLRLFLGNDTGVTHMAAAVGTPTVVVFGPMDWNVTHPWAPCTRIVRRSPPCAPCFLRECPVDHRCMNDVSPEQVIEAAYSLLAQGEGGSHVPG